jgi:hypothetical protein
MSSSRRRRATMAPILHGLSLTICFPPSHRRVRGRHERKDVFRGTGWNPHTIFEHEATGARLDFVSNSGICETTPGVAQHSGYLNVGGEFLVFSSPSIKRRKLELTMEQERRTCSSGSSKRGIMPPRHHLQRGSTVVQDVPPWLDYSRYSPFPA